MRHETLPPCILHANTTKQDEKTLAGRVLEKAEGLNGSRFGMVAG